MSFAGVPFSRDLRIAALLAGAFGALAAAAVPFILETLAPEQRMLPLPLPAFCVLLGLGSMIFYGLLAIAGLRLARGRGLDPAPLLAALVCGRRPRGASRTAAAGLGAGIACGLLIIAAVAAIRRLAPETLPDLLHPPSIPAALLASAAGSVGEEILCRLFLIALLVRILPPARGATAAAAVLSALLFGALHAPSWVFLFGGFENVPALSWTWLVGFNGFAGVIFGLLFLKYGIEGAILGHFGADLVWHAASQLA